MRKFFAVLLLMASPALAQETPQSPIVTAQLLLHAPQVKESEPIPAGVLFTLPRGWHIYWQNPGDSGIPTSLSWTVPEGISVSDIRWPAPERIDTAGLTNYGYSEKVILPVMLTPQHNAIAGDVTVKAEWLACKDICIPESAILTSKLPATSPQAEVLLSNVTQDLPRISDARATFRQKEDEILITIPVADLKLAGNYVADAKWFPIEDGIIANNSQNFATVEDNLFIAGPRGSAELPREWHGVLRLHTNPEEPPMHLLLTAALDETAPITDAAEPGTGLTFLAAILFAFLGGIILNAMPCVLPILSLKALALAKKSGAEQRAARAHGIAYALGVMATFLAIAGFMLVLKAGGAAIGWGFQLQEPSVIAALFFLMLLVALNLFGLFELPVLFGNATSDPHSRRGAFLTGALAVALATPCTAPFMAPALGATLTLPPLLTLLVFAALGAGMAAPFLLISLWPAARRALPKPGAWMGRFKQFLAFPMLATAAWLLWVLTRTTGDAGMVLALTGALIVAWLIWWAHGTPGRGVRKVLLVLAALVIAWSVGMQPNSDGVTMEEGMVRYDGATLADLREAGTPVFVDATADWCITCKINERLALRNDGVQEIFAARGITLMIADWTQRDAAITEYLAGFGRNGVPLYVYYPPHAEPVVLPQLLTPSVVKDAIEQN